MNMAPPRIPREKMSATLARSRANAEAMTFVRKTYRQPRDAARETAKKWFKEYPKAAYWTQVESWRLLEDNIVEFTMRRLPTAD
ncbi:MAG: hypothetical protein U5K75_06980 [Ahrensia sp.]|nr:hypothetical protein [Ahrensia sp.]